MRIAAGFFVLAAAFLLPGGAANARSSDGRTLFIASAVEHPDGTVTLVHAEIDVEEIPVSFRYLEIDVPDSISTETLNVEVLPGNWRSNLPATRGAGDEWLRSGRTALLRVPSVIVPMTWNVLVNPRHPDSQQVRIIHTYEQVIDPRLL